MPLAPANRARLHAALACAGTCVLWWRFPTPLTLALLLLAGAFAALAGLAPSVYAPVQRGFDALTHGLLVAVSWIALGFVYFGLFTPIRAWRALIGKDPLHLRQPPPPDGSYLRRSETAPRFDRQF